VPHSAPLAIDTASAPFDRYKSLRWLAPERSGHAPHERTRNQLFIGREKHNPVNVLIKVAAKAGLAFEQDLDNEWRSLSTINRELPDSRAFPFVHDRGRLGDGRFYLITSLFDEFPLATTIGTEHAPAELVAHLRIGIEIARALCDLHRLDIFHVDLNPMNVLYRVGTDQPVIRIVDFESSYERSRHAHGTPYNPPTTPGYSAPEVARQPPDGRADVYSLGVVLFSLLAGYRWTAGVSVGTRVAADEDLDADLKEALLRAVDPAPSRRFADMQTFLAALGCYLEQIWPGRAW
jgi:serine/threonine protein kinase